MPAAMFPLAASLWCSVCLAARSRDSVVAQVIARADPDRRGGGRYREQAIEVGEEIAVPGRLVPPRGDASEPGRLEPAGEGPLVLSDELDVLRA